jgi:endo-1,4-beta-xylanase
MLRLYLTADISATAAGTAESNLYTAGFPEERQQALAKRYAELSGTFVAHRDVIGRVTFWRVTDGDSWLNNFPDPRTDELPAAIQPFGEPKPALDAVLHEAKTK